MSRRAARLAGLPNVLTLARLWAAPCVALVFVVMPRPIADWVALALFVSASATDWIDGALARRWSTVSRFGAMLDPIADKAMIVISLATVLALSGFVPWLVVPGVVILFREICVSGLREYLGASAGRLAVTRLAKWKTTVQMAALACLFLALALQEVHYWHFRAMDPAAYEAALADGWSDFNATWRLVHAGRLTGLLGIALIWIAAILTALSGLDYFRKARPLLEEPD